MAQSKGMRIRAKLLWLAAVAGVWVCMSPGPAFAGSPIPIAGTFSTDGLLRNRQDTAVGANRVVTGSLPLLFGVEGPFAGLEFAAERLVFHPSGLVTVRLEIPSMLLVPCGTSVTDVILIGSNAQSGDELTGRFFSTGGSPSVMGTWTRIGNEFTYSGQALCGS